VERRQQRDKEQPTVWETADPLGGRKRSMVELIQGSWITRARSSPCDPSPHMDVDGFCLLIGRPWPCGFEVVFKLRGPFFRYILINIGKCSGATLTGGVVVRWVIASHETFQSYFNCCQEERYSYC